jgi:UDP-N-acetyl-D-mannosaminuronic acid dehydrogenase
MNKQAIDESTSPVMTTEKMTNLIFKIRPELEDKIYIAYCPERVLPGNFLLFSMNYHRVKEEITKIDFITQDNTLTTIIQVR